MLGNGRRTRRHRGAWITATFVAVGLVLLFGSRLLLSSTSFRQGVRRLTGRYVEADPPGHWNPVRESIAVAVDERIRQQQIDQLLSLGYSGSTDHTAGTGGITVFDPRKASPGLRFFLSGHAPQAMLMDPKGNILYTWSYDYRELWAADRQAFLRPSSSTGCWRRARLLPDGSLLAIYEGHGLIKLNSDSELIWSCSRKCHHDLDLDADGRIYVLSHDARVVPRLHKDKPVLLDSVTILSPEGVLERSIDVLQAFEHSPFAGLLPRPPVSGDAFHTNTLELLDGRLAEALPAFAAGNILISVREMDVIAVLDPEREVIVWARKGGWVRQHQPTVLDNGHIMLFDNQGQGGFSRVIEFDPVDDAVVWTYADSPETPLYSKTCGSNQRLDNGNTLIVESDNGRAFEVDPQGVIVWEYVNPYRAGEEKQLIAAVMDMEILPENTALAWLVLRDEGPDAF